MVANNYQWLMERFGGRRLQGVHEINVFTSINAKLDKLVRRLDIMGIQIGLSSSAIVYKIYSSG